MLSAEARWFERRLATFADDALFPLCNVGSAAGEGQLREQPWIEQAVFGPLRKRPGAEIVNVDLFPGDGVDLVGDLTDPAFQAELARLGVRSIFCANVLEHVEGPEKLAAQLAAVAPPGGLLFVSVPRAFPYHPDPIDTLFRPTPAETAALFPGTEVVAADEVACGTLLGYTLQRLSANPGALAGTIRRKLFGGQAGPSNAAAAVERDEAAPKAAAPVSTWKTHLPWLFRTLKVSCVVLRKK